MLHSRLHIMHAEKTHASDSSKGFWYIANIGLGAFFAVFALYWGANLVLGGIKAAKKLRAPVVAEETAPAPATPPPSAPSATPAAPVPTAAAPAEAAPAAPAPAASATAAAEITIKPDLTNPLMYDTKTFTVKAGQQVKLTFNNTHPAVPQPHNWVLGKVGTKDKLLAAAMAVMTDPKGLEKGYIPETPDVLQHTKLLQPNTSETITFVAPAAGDYPYICTFPGHGIMMNGIMKVE